MNDAVIPFYSTTSLLYTTCVIFVIDYKFDFILAGRVGVPYVMEGECEGSRERSER